MPVMTECPKCHSDYQKELTRIKSMYGSILMQEFLDLLENTRRSKPCLDLKEEGELNVKMTGLFQANYRCWCERCGWKWEWKHEESAWKDSIK